MPWWTLTRFLRMDLEARGRKLLVLSFSVFLTIRRPLINISDGLQMAIDDVVFNPPL